MYILRINANNQMIVTEELSMSTEYVLQVVPFPFNLVEVEDLTWGRRCYEKSILSASSEVHTLPNGTYQRAKTEYTISTMYREDIEEFMEYLMYVGTQWF